MSKTCGIEAGARVAWHGAFGVATELSKAVAARMKNPHFSVERDGDAGEVVTTAPMGTMAFLIAQAFADGWIIAYETHKD